VTLFKVNSAATCELIAGLSNTNLFLMGDFNYPDIDWSSGVGIPASVGGTMSLESRQFLECLEDGYLTQHVTEPTRGKAYLYLIITRDPDVLDDMNVLGRFGTSDHHIVVCQLMFGKVVLDTERHLLDYNKGDFSRARIMARELVWNKMVGSSNRIG